MFFRLSDARYHELKREIRELQDDLAQLRTHHERLRGRFYAERGSDSGPPPDRRSDPFSRAGKDAILREHLRPARPATDRQE